MRPGLPIIPVRATRGKHVRAEPIAALYTMGRISHVGSFPELEDQMCLMTAGEVALEGSTGQKDNPGDGRGRLLITMRMARAMCLRCGCPEYHGQPQKQSS